MHAMALARVAKPVVPGLVACVLILAAAGCKTTGSTPGETKYGPFFSPADHVEDLLEQDDFQSASDVYEFEHDYFSEDSKTRMLVARQLADRLVQEFSPRLEQAQIGRASCRERV